MTSETDPASVRAFLLGEAERKTFEELRPLINEPRVAFVHELADVNDDQAAYRPPATPTDGAPWCILEIVRHVIHSEEGSALRIRALGLGDPARPHTAGRVVGRSSLNIDELARDLTASRFALEHALGSVEGKERLDTTSPHPLYGEMNCRAWYLFQRLHDLEHLEQVRLIKASSGYPR